MGWNEELSECLEELESLLKKEQDEEIDQDDLEERLQEVGDRLEAISQKIDSKAGFADEGVGRESSGESEANASSPADEAMLLMVEQYSEVIELALEFINEWDDECLEEAREKLLDAEVSAGKAIVARDALDYVAPESSTETRAVEQSMSNEEEIDAMEDDFDDNFNEEMEDSFEESFEEYDDENEFEEGF